MTNDDLREMDSLSPAYGDSETAVAVAEAYPALWRASYAVFVLMLVTFTAMLDRYLPAIALGPMKNDLGLSDTSVSLVQGVAFSLFYCIAGIPLGRAVDRYNRRNLVALAVLAWTIDRKSTRLNSSH